MTAVPIPAGFVRWTRQAPPPVLCIFWRPAWGNARIVGWPWDHLGNELVMYWAWTGVGRMAADEGVAN